jgi:hypothetical protein
MENAHLRLGLLEYVRISKSHRSIPCRASGLVQIAKALSDNSGSPNPRTVRARSGRMQ